MSPPKQLTESFAKIKELPLLAGYITRANVAVFVELLNKAIPSSMNPTAHAVYRFNRSKYIADKTRFVNDIKGFETYEAMILWTDFADILAHFGLENKIFLGWDKNNNRYRGYVITAPPLSPTSVPPTPPSSPSGLPLTSPSLQREDAEEAPLLMADCASNDMDRVYNHMYERIRAINASLEKM